MRKVILDLAVTLDDLMANDERVVLLGEDVAVLGGVALEDEPPLIVRDVELMRRLYRSGESEYLIEKAINRLVSDRTSIVIAHRLSTVRGADKIVVLMTAIGIYRGGMREAFSAAGLAFGVLLALEWGSRWGDWLGDNTNLSMGGARFTVSVVLMVLGVVVAVDFATVSAGLRLLALAAGIWHNHLTGQPARAFAAYGR